MTFPQLVAALSDLDKGLVRAPRDEALRAERTRVAQLVRSKEKEQGADKDKDKVQEMATPPPPPVPPVVSQAPPKAARTADLPPAPPAASAVAATATTAATTATTAATATAATTAATATAAASSSFSFDAPFWLAPEVPDGLAYDPCTESYALAYLNDPAVQRAMHVLPAERGRAAVDYAFCNDDVFMGWALMDSYADTTHLYPEVLDTTAARGTDFALLVFSGDSDGVCGTVGTQNWIYRAAAAAGRPQMRLWQPWLLDGGHGQQGGFLTRFAGNFSFATVHTAGHEVPAYQPKAALALFAAFLDRSIFAPSNRTIDAPAASLTGDGTRGASGGIETQIMAALCVALVAGFALLLVGYFAYAKRRLEHAQRQRFGGSGDGLQEFEDTDVDADADAAVDRDNDNDVAPTLNPMVARGHGRGPAGVSILGMPDPSVTMRPAQEVLI